MTNTNWPEGRMDLIGQNGPTGEHYVSAKAVMPNNLTAAHLQKVYPNHYHTPMAADFAQRYAELVQDIGLPVTNDEIDCYKLSATAERFKALLNASEIEIASVRRERDQLKKDLAYRDKQRESSRIKIRKLKMDINTINAELNGWYLAFENYAGDYNSTTAREGVRKERDNMRRELIKYGSAIEKASRENAELSRQVDSERSANERLTSERDELAAKLAVHEQEEAIAQDIAKALQVALAKNITDRLPLELVPENDDLPSALTALTRLKTERNNAMAELNHIYKELARARFLIAHRSPEDACREVDWMLADLLAAIKAQAV